MVVGCRSGALLLSQIVKHASVPNRNNAERLRNVFSNSEDKLKEDVGAALQYSAKECASIDLARQLRSFSPVVGGSTACLPLSVTFADNKTQSGRGILCGTLIVAMLQSVAFIQMQVGFHQRLVPPLSLSNI